MLVTCKQFSDLMGVEYLQASNILKVFTTKGVAVEVSTNRTNKRGRPTIIYDVPENITMDLIAGTILEIEKCQSTT